MSTPAHREYLGGGAVGRGRNGARVSLSGNTQDLSQADQSHGCPRDGPGPPVQAARHHSGKNSIFTGEMIGRY